MSPLLGEAFLISQISALAPPAALDSSAARKPRGAEAAAARRSSSARLSAALRAATQSRLSAQILFSTSLMGWGHVGDTDEAVQHVERASAVDRIGRQRRALFQRLRLAGDDPRSGAPEDVDVAVGAGLAFRSEEHTSELQSL